MTRPGTRSSGPREHLLLVGAGHSHLHLLLHAARLHEAGYDVTLVAPQYFFYSGAAAAVATGHLPVAAARIDIARLAARSGVTHHVGRLASLDPTERTARTDDGTALHWDVACLNLGSTTAWPTDTYAPGGTDTPPATVLRAKPLDDLGRLAELPLKPERPVVVVGAGASGVEIAAQLGVARGPHHAGVMLIEQRPQIAPGLPAAARRRLAAMLAERGVRIRTGRSVVALDERGLLLDDGTDVAHAGVVLASGLTAPAEVLAWGIGDADGIPVLPTLRHRDIPGLYATGDCAHFLADPLPRVGVHGVRQGPVLLDALLARREGRPAPRYRPRRRHLAILDLGDGQALAVRGRLWWSGRTPLRLKRRIDRSWVARYSDSAR
ncbi:MAG: NAD(P)/FAD-dependent oxidoreductase [Dermatophilaceae bacterium]